MSDDDSAPEYAAVGVMVTLVALLFGLLAVTAGDLVLYLGWDIPQVIGEGTPRATPGAFTRRVLVGGIGMPAVAVGLFAAFYGVGVAATHATVRFKQWYDHFASGGGD